MNVQDVIGVFVVGDASSVVCDGPPVPGVAQAAIQQGCYVGRLISRQLKGREQKRPFRYFDKGNMAVVGKNFAILESGRLRIGGPAGSLGGSKKRSAWVALPPSAARLHRQGLERP